MLKSFESFDIFQNKVKIKTYFFIDFVTDPKYQKFYLLDVKILNKNP